MEKVDEGYSLEEHEEGESRHLGAPLRRLELGRELEEIRRGEAWKKRGHIAKTLVKYPDLRVVLIAMKKGANIGEHKTKARITIHAVEGRVLVKLDQQTVDLPAGCLLGAESSIPHDVEAQEESAILLTLAWPTKRA